VLGVLNKMDRKEYFKEYYENNRDKLLPKQKEYKKKQYWKDRKRLLKENQEYYKERYNSDEQFKREMQIRNKTRLKFPLKNKKCENCGNKAEEHHHNTKPIEFDKFNYVCKGCHKQHHRAGGFLRRKNERNK